jgi:imidazolonepropionase-like amidohydrolase
MQNNNITLRQARLQGREGLWQLTIENGRFSRIEPQDTATLPQGEVLDAEGGLAIPPFVEPHIHLDTTQTEKCSVNTEEKITEENCQEEIIIGKTGTECATGPHTGGKKCKPQHDKC